MSGETLTMDEENLNAMMEGVMKGAGLGESAGITKDTLEAGYALAFSLYNSGNFKDAEVLFQALSIYDHTDERYWMGLAGCRQMNGRLEEAIDAYNMASFQSSFSDPAPMLHSGLCYLKLGDKENALALFDALLELGDPKKSEHRACHERARAMLDMLKKEEGGKA